MHFSPASLRRFLDQSFSGRATAISELLQNSRRAGATYIDIVHVEDDNGAKLTFNDNGCGITDLATLLTPGESGWDDATMEKDDPFGLGFRAALLNAERVLVRSKFGRFESSTDDLLNGVLPVVEPDDIGHTQVTLINPKIPDVSTAVRRLAYAFPVPVTFNGRTVSKSLLRLTETERFTLYFNTEAGALLSIALPTIQGLPVQLPRSMLGLNFSMSENSLYRTPTWVVDLKGVAARVPDRDALLNPEDVAPFEVEAAMLSLVATLHAERHHDLLHALSQVSTALEREIQRCHSLVRGNVVVYRQDEKYDDNSQPQVALGDNSEWRRERLFCTPKAVSFNHLPVSEDNGEDGIIERAWAGNVDQDVEWHPADRSIYLAPNDHELEFHVVVEGEKLRFETYIVGLKRTVVLAESLSIVPRWFRDNGQELAQELDAASVPYVYDAAESTLYLTDAHYRQYRGLAYQHDYARRDDDYEWDENWVEGFVNALNAEISTRQRGDTALQSLAVTNLSSTMPVGCVAVRQLTDTHGSHTSLCLTNTEGQPLEEGVGLFLREFPAVAEAIAKAWAER